MSLSCQRWAAPGDAAVAAEAVVGNGAQASEVAAAIEEIPGAEVIALRPSMRGDKRVAVRFNLAARQAAESAPHSNYVEKFEASDNLRWSLSTENVAADEKPLGHAAEQVPAAGGAITTAER